MSAAEASDPVPASDAFVCHATSDGVAAARSIVSGLEARGLRCWIAPRDIPAGMSWPSAIVDGVERSRAAILVLSAGAVRSPEVEKEVTLASHLNKAVLPLRIADVTLSGGLLFHLQSRQWRDLFADQEGTLDEVAAQLGSTTRPVRPAVKVATPARRRAPTLAALAVAALAGATGFHLWRNGRPEADAILRASVVRFEDTANGLACTGLLVGGSRVLTADYCFRSDGSFRIGVATPEGGRVYPVEARGEAGATSATVLVSIRDSDGTAPGPAPDASASAIRSGRRP